MALQSDHLDVLIHNPMFYGDGILHDMTLELRFFFIANWTTNVYVP